MAASPGISLRDLVQEARQENLIVVAPPEPKPDPEPVEPKAPFGHRECNRHIEILRRRSAQDSRRITERQQKLDYLRAAVRRRDARIEVLEGSVSELKSDLKAAAKREAALEKTTRELGEALAMRDLQLQATRKHITELKEESRLAGKALETIKLRAHDWLVLRENLAGERYA